MPELINQMLQSIELELKKQVSRLDEPFTNKFHDMLTYHMGWSGEGAGPEAAGKRIRPLIVLLTAAAISTESTGSPDSNWKSALPAAAAMELIHNFSLVHDDIQDNSEKRRGRSTVWVKWGMAQAINAGDALFVLANLAAADLHNYYPAEKCIRAIKLIQGTCLSLTRGQYLDMDYPNRADLSVEDYWPMVSGKTAALLSCCCELGAILGGADESTIEAYKSFGHYLGLAFQVQDDILGIWGTEEVTGKSASSDLIEGKKSLPVLYGLAKKGKFAERWAKGPITANDVEEAAKLLIIEGSHSNTNEASRQMTDMAINSLREANPSGEAGVLLSKLADQLIKRES